MTNEEGQRDRRTKEEEKSIFRTSYVKALMSVCICLSENSRVDNMKHTFPSALIFMESMKCSLRLLLNKMNIMSADKK